MVFAFGIFHYSSHLMPCMIYLNLRIEIHFQIIFMSTACFPCTFLWLYVCFLTTLLWKLINKCTNYPSYCNNHRNGAHAFISLMVELATSGFSMYMDPYDLIHTLVIDIWFMCVCTYRHWSFNDLCVCVSVCLLTPFLFFMKTLWMIFIIKMKNDCVLCFFCFKIQKKFLTQCYRKWQLPSKLTMLLFPLRWGLSMLFW